MFVQILLHFTSLTHTHLPNSSTRPQTVLFPLAGFPGDRPMNPIIVNPGVHFQSQLKRLFPRKQSKKEHHVSVETLCRKSLRLCEVQCITRCTEHLFNAVTNGKPMAVKAHHFILRWLNGDKRASKSLQKSSPPPHEHLDTPYTLDPKWSFTQSVLEM